QTASSNLAHGADFAQPQGATVAGRYDDFEEDFQVGDAAPELHADEAEAEAEDDNEHTAELARIEELAEAYKKVDEAREAAEDRLIARQQAGEDVSADEAKLEAIEAHSGFRCQQVDQFFCRIIGPQSQAQNAAAALARTRERDAASQKLEMASALKKDEAA